MMPGVDEIVDVVEGEENQSSLPQVYADYLERMEADYLDSCRFLDFLSNLGIAASANAANHCVVYICCDMGISWFSSFSLGLGFGLIPAAYYLNKAGISFGETLIVDDAGNLLKAGAAILGGGAIAWNAAGEKRLLVRYTQDGRKESAKLIAEYEVKAPALNNKWLDYTKDLFSNGGNLIALPIACFLLWKFVIRRGY
jgi:hypothetical protein